MPTRTKAGLVVVLAALAMTGALAGCSVTGNPLDTGDAAGGRAALTVGSQGSPESEILAQLYGQVLENAGYPVEYDLSIGSREVFLEALREGSIDVIPDYAGNLLYGSDPRATATTIDEILVALPDVLEPLGLEILEPAAAEDADALVVTTELAAANGLVSISDLAPIASTLTLGANTEFDTRWFSPLSRTYGVTGLTFKAIDDYGGEDTVQDLVDNVIQIADIHTTSPAIAAHGLVVLEDPEHLFPAQNVVPVIDADLYTDDLARLLNGVSVALTSGDLIELRERYAGDDKPSAADLATEWLTSRGLLG